MMKTKIDKIIRIRLKDVDNSGPGNSEINNPKTIYLEKDPPHPSPGGGTKPPGGVPSGGSESPDVGEPNREIPDPSKSWSKDKSEFDRKMESDYDYTKDKTRVSWGSVQSTGSLGDSEKSKEEISSKMDELVQTAMSQSLENDPMAKRIAKRLEGLKAPIVDWKSELEMLIEKTLSKTEYKLPSRRFGAQKTAQYGYRKKKEESECIVVAIDTSGSISDKMVHRFLSETQAIVSSFSPRDLYVIFCHTTIYRVDHYLPGEKISDGELKSGGTEFWPPFSWVEEHLIEEGIIPSIFLYFTDGYADFPSPGNYSISDYLDKIIWVVLGFGEKSTVTTPWGIRMDIVLPNKSSEL